MPQYVILQGHPPGDCPISSKGARDWAKKVIPEIENMAKKMGVKFVMPWVHLDPSHKGLLVVEARSAETVRDFLVQGGLFHFLDSEFYMTTPIADLLKEMDKVPTIYP